MKRVRLIQQAETELVDALIYHETHWKNRGRNLHEEFMEVVDKIGSDPLRFPPADRRHRKATLKTCPYSLIYRELPDFVWVVAIAHHKRKDGFWKRRKIPRNE